MGVYPNNTYRNTLGITVNGTSATDAASAINNANLYNISGNVNGNGELVITYGNPGPIQLWEIDIINTPLANAGISTSNIYGENSNLTVITGNVANPIFGNGSILGMSINWNAIADSMTQTERAQFKGRWIAQPLRQSEGEPYYDVLNVWIDTHAPTPGNPWGYANGNPPNISVK